MSKPRGKKTRSVHKRGGGNVENARPTYQIPHKYCQGSPLLGMAFAVRGVTLAKVLSMLVCTLASSLLVAHVFSLNDWAGIAPDSNDPNKSSDVFVTRGISRPGVAALSLGLLAASLLLLALLPLPTLLLGIAIAALGAIYSLPVFDAKGAPVASSLPHLVG